MFVFCEQQHVLNDLFTSRKVTVYHFWCTIRINLDRRQAYALNSMIWYEHDDKKNKMKMEKL